MSTYKEAYDKSLEYFKGDELAANIFVSKYALTDNAGDLKELTPDDMHKRLSKEFARIESKYPNPLLEDEIYSLLKDFKYIVPQGSPMNAIGNDYQIQSIGNCFVIAPVLDSYGGIMHSDQQLVQLMKRRCGCGLDISNIRPKGILTQNAARSTDGIGLFMERFSNTCREVAQGGRRGALMQTISIHHPEVETFINIKKDKKKVTGANISVRVSNDFMEAVKSDSEYEQFWPMTGDKKIATMTKAKSIWNQIIASVWEGAEPGVLFWDRITSQGPSGIYGEVDEAFKDVSTNPCQPAWAKILTKHGIVEMKDVHVGDEIWSSEGWTTITNKQSAGIKKVYKYKTSANVFYGTENHKLISNGEKIEAKDAKNIDYLRGYSEDFYKIDVQDVMDGLVIGDGTVHKRSNNLVYLLVGKKDHDYFESDIKDLFIKHRPGLSDTAYEIKTTIKHNELPKTYERRVPERFIKDKNRLIGFLRGLYSANGSICGNRVTLKATSLGIIEDVQLMLSSIGIRSYMTTNKEKMNKFANGTYLCRESYDLQITTDRMKFKNLIGFLQNYKNENLKEEEKSDRGEIMSYDIKKVDFISEEEVFDITVDNNSHTYWTQGCNVSNCGEIPMGTDSCRLLVVNLLSFVKNPFTTNAKFDYVKFSDISYKAQRLMDDVVDLELEKIDKILAKIESDDQPDFIKAPEKKMWEDFKLVCIKGRRTGLGITALGDALAALNIRYGSDESIKKTEKIYKTLAVNAYRSSIHMAKERGKFPIFDYKLEKNHEFLNRIIECLDEEDITTYKKYGRRNIALTTTAPTGTVSTLTQTTSGIEPAYLLKYTRRKKINPIDTTARVDFVDDLGDRWQEFPVYHHGFKMWMDITGKENIEDSPYHKATSNDIDWVASVKIQGVAQKWICHAISKTCNLPNDASRELISEIYMKAYEEGCKGFTVYRDGCRSGVLISQDETKEDLSFKEYNAPKRPDALDCDIHQTNIKGEPWTVFVGKYDNKPYEIFGGLSKYVSIPKKYKSGKISKNGKVAGKRLYDLSYGIGDEETWIKDIVRVFENPTEGEFTRILSLSLRHGSPIQYVVEQLQKDDKNSDMYSFSKVIARVLKHYIKDGSKSTDKKCTSCGSENSLIYKEGCLICSNCGYSKCG